VAELSDEVAPRVHPERPNLYVGLTIEDPQRRFARLKGGIQPDHPVHLHGVAPRPDLYEHLTSYADPTAAKAAKSDLMRELRRQGFVVKRTGHCYRVYVILLRDVGPREHPDKPWVYVGQTTKDIDARFKEHVEGARTVGGRRLYSRVVRKYHEKLLPELYESIPGVYLQEDALRLEKEVAERLAAEGYSVRGGH
jgi:predicted GIY-YIG superfamily endonuclease